MTNQIGGKLGEFVIETGNGNRLHSSETTKLWPAWFDHKTKKIIKSQNPYHSEDDLSHEYQQNQKTQTRRKAALLRKKASSGIVIRHTKLLRDMMGKID